MGGIIIEIIQRIFELYEILILINILGSWIDPYNQIQIFQWVRKLTDPYLGLFKIVIPIGNMNLDLSGLIGLMILELIKEVFLKTVFMGMF